MSIIAAIIVLGIIIFFHELGHFTVAKLSGIFVEKFSIGFPPTVLSKKVGETEYALGIIPFGGYVKMRGENPDSPDETERSFRDKSPWVRMAVLAAGPIMNIVLGYLIIVLVLIIFGEISSTNDSPKVGSVVKKMPASSNGIAAGDMILSIDSDSISTWSQLTAIVHSQPEKTLTFKVLRGDSTFNLSILTQKKTIQTANGTDSTIGVIGITPEPTFQKVPFFAALAKGAVATCMLSMLIFGSLWQLITGSAPMADVGGPIMIAQLAGEAAKTGMWNFMFFIAALSVNLAVLNLLPLPILDGGQMLFTFIEALRKKRVSLKVQAIFQQVSIVFLFILMVLVTVKDIFRLF